MHLDASLKIYTTLTAEEGIKKKNKQTTTIFKEAATQPTKQPTTIATILR